MLQAGLTPYCAAVSGETVQLLREHGADTDAKWKIGSSKLEKLRATCRLDLHPHDSLGGGLARRRLRVSGAGR